MKRIFMDPEGVKDDSRGSQTPGEGTNNPT
jgi:hypothetical protein